MNKAASALTRKAGPLPVWGWAALALAGWFLFMRGGGAAASGGLQLPYTPGSSGSAAQTPASGMGSAADNSGSDLASALSDNFSSSDALLAALQSFGSGGGYGTASGGTGSADGGTATAGTTAPTVTDNTTPVDTQPTYASDVPVPTDNIDPATGLVLVNVSPTGSVTDTLSGAPILEHPPGTTVTSPTQAVVQPAPVDTTGVLTTKPVLGVTAI